MLYLFAFYYYGSNMQLCFKSLNGAERHIYSSATFKLWYTEQKMDTLDVPNVYESPAAEHSWRYIFKNE